MDDGEDRQHQQQHERRPRSPRPRRRGRAIVERKGRHGVGLVRWVDVVGDERVRRSRWVVFRLSASCERARAHLIDPAGRLTRTATQPADNAQTTQIKNEHLIMHMQPVRSRGLRASASERRRTHLRQVRGLQPVLPAACLNSAPLTLRPARPEHPPFTV